MTRALVIGRRRRGRPIEQGVSDVRRRLEDAGWNVDSRLVDRKRHLRKEAAAAVKDDVDVVAVVGGDGAVLQVVQVLAEARAALGIIPFGTGNLLAGNLGIPSRLDRAVDVLVNGSRRTIDLGRLTIGDKKRLYSVACGIGFDAEVMAATKRAQKDRWGKLAYIASAIRRSAHVRDVRHEIRIDGARHTVEATQVFIANLGRMGLAVKPRLQIEPDDGLLDVIVIRASGRLPGLLAGWEALRQHEEGKSPQGHVFRARAREVKIECQPSRMVEIDGSVVGTTPIKVSVVPAALTVLVPAIDGHGGEDASAPG